MKLFFIIILFLLASSSYSQETNQGIEQQMEKISEDQEEESDNDLMLTIENFQKHPLNINNDEILNLKELPFVDNLKINNLIKYKNLFGNIISIHEIQAIPGWDIEFIRQILPFITIDNNNIDPSFFKRFNKGNKTLLFRVSRVLERSDGYFKDENSKYLGSSEKLFLKYRYQFKNLLQYGIVAEKDAGEQFFKGSAKTGFDFYSFHLSAKNIGKINTAVLGDYTASLGQGLIWWQSFSLGKGPEILAIKRQGAIIKPYSSAGEYNFLRGAAITLEQKDLSATFFVSHKKMDGNLKSDSSNLYISSLQTSGFHRTKSEIEDRKIQRVFTVGGNFNYKIPGFQIGVNMVHEKYKMPVIKSELPYNNFNFSGKNFTAFSSDFSFTKNNFHFFGEVAHSGKGNALVVGALSSLSSQISLSLLYRVMGKSFSSIKGDAFSESSNPTNEKGFFAGINIKLPNRFTINGYFDVFEFPFLKYRINNSTAGFSAMIQANYKPNKSFEGYAYFKTKQKGINESLDAENIHPVFTQNNKNFRVHFWLKINSSFSISSRGEISFYRLPSSVPENGFMFFTDLIYKEFGKKWSANSRFQYFETGSYNTRIYSYEKDVLSASTIPALFDKGYRLVLNSKYNFNNYLSFWFKISQTIYIDKEFTGSGSDKIPGNKKTEMKLQAVFAL